MRPTLSITPARRSRTSPSARTRSPPRRRSSCSIGIAIVIVLISGSLGSLLYGALAPLVLCVAHAALKETSLAAKVAAKVDSALDSAEDKLDKAAEAARKRVNAVLPQKN
jgi:hypothetical protein